MKSESKENYTVAETTTTTATPIIAGADEQSTTTRKPTEPPAPTTPKVLVCPAMERRFITWPRTLAPIDAASVVVHMPCPNASLTSGESVECDLMTK